MITCSEGHQSVATDYCDVCGSPIGAQPTVAPVSSSVCPMCGVSISGRFCEVCGHDSALPAPAAASTGTQAVSGGSTVTSSEATAASSDSSASGGTTWIATVTADRDFYDRVLARKGPDADQVGFPEVYPERRIVLRGSEILIGKRSVSQGLEPDIDLSIAPTDIGVSRSHAMLRITESGVTITDLGSTNGTSLNGSDELIPARVAVALDSGARIHLGGWTTIVLSAE